jgi:dipeptidyl-peptidase-4
LKIAYSLNNNVYVAGVDNSIIKVTTDGNDDIINGNIVSRNEFGISKGLFWSPDGSKLAFYRKDVTLVSSYPLVDISKRVAEYNAIKYPMAGMGSEHVSVGVYSIDSGITSYIEKEDTTSYKYLTNVTWDNASEYIYVQVLNREQNHLKLNRYSVDGALMNTLFEEKHAKYIEPENELIFLKNKSDKFLYQSRINGYRHIYLCSEINNTKEQITSGNWEVTQVLGLDKAEQNVFFISTKESPLERHLYKVNLKSKKVTKITSVSGTHKIKMHSNGKLFIDTYSSTDVPAAVDIINAKGKVVGKQLRVANPLKEYKMPNVSLGLIKADDNKTDLFYRLIKPADFDSTKKYPVIIYVYGGPHAQMITNRWLAGARMWQYYMAQEGYVLFTVDNRGSANRGLEFENVIHRQLGVVEMKDQMKGVEFLKSLGYVDEDRIGVHGWSFGGFMTTSLMTHHPDVFKVGVAGGPVIDWKYYEVMYGERYMDTPQGNPEGYLVTSLLPRVEDLKGKLLLIHGGEDPVVVWQHSQLFVRECVKKNIPLDYFVYPKAEHNVRGYDRLHLMQKVITYFNDFLK